MKLPLLSLASLSLAAVAGPALAQTNLTMWQYGDCTPDACIERALIDAFEAANPDIKIELVSQPPDGYFTALLAASVIGRGPDLAAMWAGRYMTDFEDYMTDLHPYIPSELIESANGADYFAKDNNADNALYAAPVSAQWYTGFYNKKIFADNNIAVPTTWDEMMAACETLKGAGVLPIIQGANGGSAQFQPLFEWAYLAAAMPLGEWGSLLDGSTPYANPTLEAQVEKWNGLYDADCVNDDAFNYPNTLEDFRTGKAAMLLGAGSWNVAELANGLGDDLGVLIPPFSDEKQDALVALAGTGYAVMNYSENQEEAAKFLAFMLSDEGQTIISKFDAPPRPGFPTNRPQIDELIAMSASGDYTVYPMFDNFTHPSESDAIYRNMALAFVGQASATDALAAVDAAHASLPEDQKALTFTFATE